MAALSKQTIQRLAVLRAIDMWQKGAPSGVRLQKTLFFADKKLPKSVRRLFTFRRWHLGQYSDEVSEAINSLLKACRITVLYDGPADLLRTSLSQDTRRIVQRFFSRYFPEWNRGLRTAFKTWAYLNNDELVRKAHDDPAYTSREHGDVISESFPEKELPFPRLSDHEAERLSDLVDERLQKGLRERLSKAVLRRAAGEDWRRIYFEPAAAKSGPKANGER